MTVCKYYLAGNCRFGDNCRFEHPPRADANANDAGGRSDPFATSTNNSFNNDSTQNEKDAPPTWPLTAIALPDASAGNLVGDEYSPDEMRVQAYRAAPRGNNPDVARREAELLQEHKAKEVAAIERNKPKPIAAQDPFAGAQQNGTTFGGNSDSMLASTPFGGSNPSSTFGGQANVPTSSSFGNSNPSTFNTSAPSQTQGPFSTPVQPSPTSMVKQEPTLSTRDLAQYNAPSFGFDPVPETAPPARFC